jgi:molecular chaperone GrpE
VTTPKHDIAEAADTREEGAPTGAPESASEPLQQSVPAGEPEAPVAPVGSVESESVAAPSQSVAQDAASPDVPSPGVPSTGVPSEQTAGREPGANASEPAADAPAEEHERKLAQDLEQLTAKAEKADEYLELAQRTRADFENFRRRAAREAAAAQERGITKLAKELLPAVDNLDRALQAAQAAASGDHGSGQAENGTAATLASGIKLVHDDVVAALGRAGIEGFSPEGERFDPQVHEAVAQIPAEGAESGTVVEVYQRGYRIGDVVIRPARVVVAA